VHGRQINYWIALADIVFMLFVVALIVAAREQVTSQRLAREQKTLVEANRTLRTEMDSLYRCRGAEVLLDGFSGCLSRTFRTSRHVERDLCAVTVGEDLIRFTEGSDRPIDPTAARQVIRCLYDSTRTFAGRQRGDFDAIANIDLDGFTDCKGTVASNVQLGARRALQLYSMLLQEVEADRDTPLAPEEKRRFLSKFAVRSFGQVRPVPQSRCNEVGQFADDRRVTISIEMRPQRSAGAPRGKD